MGEVHSAGAITSHDLDVLIQCTPHMFDSILYLVKLHSLTEYLRRFGHGLLKSGLGLGKEVNQ